MKIVTVVGARPQFIKAAAVSRVIRNSYQSKVNEIILHTGQHYDENMSAIFFDELDISHPKYNLDVSNLSHGKMTGRMLELIEEVLIVEQPDCVLIYGDTNSTLAAALAAAKLQIPIAHVEAGLRSFNMRMPEEINRLVADRLSSHLFCPTLTAASNLANEGITDGVQTVGDVMYDAALFYKKRALDSQSRLKNLDVLGKEFVLATCHREENTDNPQRLLEIVSALGKVAEDFPVVFALHPRTRKIINERKLLHFLKKVTVTEPLSFLDMVALEQGAKIIMTDSGGIQKEAFFFEVPCLTMRNETEWVETIDANANILVGTDSSLVEQSFANLESGKWQPNFDARPYGCGNAAETIVNSLVTNLG
jgi:UDP-GlcNAc3NAcA epimerase